MVSQVILVTGALTGFGAITARKLACEGHTVFASMKDEDAEAFESVRSFAKEHNCSLHPLVLDVTSDSSCADAIAAILEQCDHLDTIVHNAGHMGYGPSEAFTSEQFLHYYNINTLGPHRVNQAALPHMRKRRTGLLVWVSSSSTAGATEPFIGPYFAAKAAMDSLAVTYSTELSRFGIETSIVLPGIFLKGTSHFQTCGHPDRQDVANEYWGTGNPYDGLSQQLLDAFSRLQPEWADVEEIPRQIVRVIGLERGTRPFRVYVDPIDNGCEAVNRVRQLARKEVFGRLGVSDLLQIRQ